MQVGARRSFVAFFLKKNSMETDENIYHRYHKTAGYNIDECRDLKKQVEAVIRQGQL